MMTKRFHESLHMLQDNASGGQVGDIEQAIVQNLLKKQQ